MRIPRLSYLLVGGVPFSVIDSLSGKTGELTYPACPAILFLIEGGIPLTLIWSERRESNPRNQLGRLVFYH